MTTGKSFTALLLYMDDIIIASDSLDSIVVLKQFLYQKIKVKISQGYPYLQEKIFAWYPSWFRYTRFQAS